MESQLCGGVFVCLTFQLDGARCQSPADSSHPSISKYMVSLIIISNVLRTLLIYLISSRSHSLLFAQESRLSGFIHYLACLRSYIYTQREPLKCERILFSTQRVERKEKRVSFHASTKRAEVGFFSLLSSMRVNYTLSWN